MTRNAPTPSARKKPKPLKEYVVNGVSTYAHCFSLSVKAHSARQAKLLAKGMDSEYIDPASAEFQGAIFDTPTEE